MVFMAKTVRLARFPSKIIHINLLPMEKQKNLKNLLLLFFILCYN